MDIGRCCFAGEYDLFGRRLKVLNEAQQLLLRLSEPSEIMHIVHQQQIQGAQAIAERLGLPGSSRREEGLLKSIEREVVYGRSWRERLRQLTDGHHQMRLPHTRAPADEERVVRAPWRFRDRPRRRHGQLVRRTDNERIERESRIEPDTHAGAS